MHHICYFCEWRISGPEFHTCCFPERPLWLPVLSDLCIGQRKISQWWSTLENALCVSSLHFCPRPSNSHLANCIIRKWLWYIEPSLKFELGRATIGQSSFGQGSGDIRPVDWIFLGHPPQWAFSETWWQADSANWEGRELRLCSCSLSLMILTQLLGRG